MLDANGWAEIPELLEKMNAHQFNLSIEDLIEIVKSSDKKRFAFSEDGIKIRANQGHSVEVDLQLAEQIPPDLLYHGTAEKNIASIKEKGLLKGERHQVHLSADAETARKVGMRHGKPVVLVIRSGEMHQQGIAFFLSKNNVWLTDYVEPGFIEFPE